MGGGGASHNPFDIFESFFARSRGRRQKKSEDVVHPLKVSLEDLYNGTSRKLSLSRNVICSKCKGYEISTLTPQFLHSEASLIGFHKFFYGYGIVDSFHSHHIRP